MVTRSSEAAQPDIPAPVVKRKRRASCLGEQERRERKRAIDREAQRSLREKTKTHIAELERTIQILRDQDRNGATANLLHEIEGLRAENERLRDVIDSVKSLVGGDIFPRPAQNTNGVSNGGAGGSPQTPKPRATSFSQGEGKPSLSLPSPPNSHTSNTNPFDFQSPIPPPSRTVDLDGMTVMADLPSTTDPNLDLNLDLDPVEEIPQESNMLDADSPATAAWVPFMTEMFGHGWRCPSPTILHFGHDSASTSASSSPNSTCPIWKKSNEIFGKVFQYRPGTSTAFTSNRSFRGWDAEAGLLFRGIKDGWSSFNEWEQSPALEILKNVDEFLFANLPRMERLAATYKSFKLLKYYLNATKEELEKVPEWLRPSIMQSSTSHPIAVDFFAWPTLRSRLMNTYGNVFRTQDMSHCYAHYLRFDWPFSFEDAFFYDERLKGWRPSPLFERYHGDIGAWHVGEEFYVSFPEMRGDIEGDRIRFKEVL
ncbi:hypothetical protein P280DRAFT_394905 [Massarina eburnea CBS 473.64]|uniref:BZIP domain-containing protein n=1 Tax=Massarina eburnea CBS 473.64 TaxID=1395130 RepID=A0A6A6S9R2_9PLEO|nr:hypothetical protein P280DRAFT_394905 [Massarina eburnea CBS 473.64]